MKRIILICSGGMSTSFLVSKMHAAAAAEAFECEIEALSLIHILQSLILKAEALCGNN